MERHLQLRFGSSGKVEGGGELKLATHFGRNGGGGGFFEQSNTLLFITESFSVLIWEFGFAGTTTITTFLTARTSFPE